MIKIIYQPMSAYPYNNVVDGTVDNEFSYIFNGDKLISYKISIYKNNTDTSVYTSENISHTAYNGDTVSTTIPKSSFTNNQELIWNITMYQETPTIFVTTGTTQSGSSTTTIKMRSHPAVKNGMYITINGQQKKLVTYTEKTLNRSGTVGADSEAYKVKIGTGLTIPSSAEITIDSESRDIVFYDSTTGFADISVPFTTIPTSGKSYSIYDLSLGTGTLDSALSSAPAAKVEYQIYSDFIISPFYFFKSQSLPVVAVTNVKDITSRKYIFYGSYSQLENIPIKYHNWKLYDQSNDLIDSTSNIFSAYLKYEFDGFINGQSYYIELVCENQDGVLISTGKKQFNVTYDTPSSNSPPKVQLLEDKNAIKISYYDARQTFGIASGENTIEVDPQFPSKVLSIQSGNVTYQNSKFTRDMTYLLYISTHRNKEGELFSIEDEIGVRSLSINGYDIYKTIDGVTSHCCSIFAKTQMGQTVDGIPKRDTAYIWDDNAVWNDDYFWTETVANIADFKYKVMVTPEDIVVTIVPRIYDNLTDNLGNYLVDNKRNRILV